MGSSICVPGPNDATIIEQRKYSYYLSSPQALAISNKWKLVFIHTLRKVYHYTYKLKRKEKKYIEKENYTLS